MSATTTAEHLIAQSIQTTSIVHAEATPALMAALSLASEDDVQNGAVHEYWGTEDGSEWRVHLDLAAAEVQP